MDWSKIFELGGAGLSLLNTATQNSGRDDFANIIRDREDANYNQAKAENEAWNSYLNGVDGAGAANAGAANARAGAIGGAFAASEGRRINASKEARGDLKKTHKRALTYLNPYRQAGQAMIPLAQDAYSQGMEGMSLLNAYMQSPSQIAKMDQGGPILSMNKNLGNLPEWMK